MSTVKDFEAVSVKLLREIASRTRSMERRQIRIETRLHRYFEHVGVKVELALEPANPDNSP